MCGITIIASTQEFGKITECKYFNRLKELIDRRGPDCKQLKGFDVPDSVWHLSSYGSTLWTQGESPTCQPLITERGSFLLWNGDVYNDNFLLPTKCDSLTVLEKIEETGHPLNVLPQIRGPYAFIYYDPNTRSVWFGRDPIGRCSLVIHQRDQHFMISSVAHKNINCIEVPSHGIFRVTFQQNDYKLSFYPWSNCKRDTTDELNKLEFSVQQSMVHEILETPNETDWMSLKSENEDVNLNYKKLVDDNDPLNILESLSSCEQFRSVLDLLLDILLDSVRLRVSIKPRVCQNCSLHNHSTGSCDHSKVGILFSGGLDSTILAVLAHQELHPSEPIDLYNVAFDKPSAKADKAPDRITGHAALKELRNIAPNRKWNFVEITIGESELNNYVHHIADLIHPLNSVLDESLGCALWFAARGEGLLNSSQYTSPARIVLVGMGADELFGGYSRHAKIFRQTKSWFELGNMLHREIQNIGSRNLGRDNRVISDHGRMMRAPFLDESFINYVIKLPPWSRCCPSSELPRGVGDKTLLRLAALALGLRETSVQPKRALQFGSRIANSKQKGHEVSTRLTDSLPN